MRNPKKGTFAMERIVLIIIAIFVLAILLVLYFHWRNQSIDIIEWFLDWIGFY